MTAGLPDRAADRERECTCCPPGKRPAIEHAKGCPRRAPRTVPLSASSVGEQIAALAARPAPNDGDARDDREDKPCPRCGQTCVYDGWDHVHPNGLGIGSCAVSPVPGQQRQAVADELARHTDTLSYTRDDDTVCLGCRCGFDRGTVTKAELATNLDGRMRAYRLHVADAVIAVIEGHQP